MLPRCGTEPPEAGDPVHPTMLPRCGTEPPEAGDPVHPNHPAPPLGQLQRVEETAWAAVLRFYALARLARADVLGDIEVLPYPEGDSAHQQPPLGLPKVSSDRPIVALAQHLGLQAPSCWDA
jgi:hypothetical protein